MNTEIDDAIRQNPELLKAVQEASGFLERHAIDIAPWANGLSIRWEELSNSKWIRLVIRDAVHTSEYFFSPRRLLDATIREMNVISAFRAFLWLKVNSKMEQVDESINGIEEQLQHA